jgi:hypothetical protein
MKTIKKQCLYCSKEFDAPLREVRRGYGKFCNSSHAALFHGNQIRVKTILNVGCAYCNKKFHKSKSGLQSSKSKLYFCCRQHKDLAQRLDGIKAIHPDHYGNGNSAYRIKAIRTFGARCNHCKYDKCASALTVHHKNRNRADNALSNLEVLCSNCHFEEHHSVEAVGNDPT